MLLTHPHLPQILKLKAWTAEARVTLLEEFAAHFACSAPATPQSIRIVFTSLRRESLLRFGDDSPIAITVFFLRFLCPAVLDPSSVGAAVKLKQQQSERLKLLSKLLLEVVKAKFDCAVSLSMESSGQPAEHLRQRLLRAHHLLQSSFQEFMTTHCTLSPEPAQGKSRHRALTAIASSLAAAKPELLRKALRSCMSPPQDVVDLCTAVRVHAPARTLSLPARLTPCAPTEELMQWLRQQAAPAAVLDALAGLAGGEQFVELTASDLAALGLTALGHQIKVARLQKLFRQQNSSVAACAAKRSRSSGDVGLWTEEDVADWLTEHGLAAYEDDAREQHMNGPALLSLSEQQLDGLNMYALGHRKKLMALVRQLQQGLKAPYSWSVDEVGQWLKKIGLGQYLRSFDEVSGQLLFLFFEALLQCVWPPLTPRFRSE